jgi:hypothetical protein
MQKRQLAAEEKRINAEFAEIEQRVIAALDDIGVTSASCPEARVTIQEAEHPQVEDWDAFYAFIYETKQAFLLQRRPSVAPLRELMNQGESVAGITTYVKRTLSLRSQ